MHLLEFRVAGGGGRAVFINPDQVVCVLESGSGRTQVVTTGLTGEGSMSLIVDGDPDETAQRLNAAVA